MNDDIEDHLRLKPIERIDIGGVGPRWLPPRPRPSNEAAGWLGYYARVWLPTEFDLVDVDGSNPVVWHYWKAKTQVYRMFEEKPSGQEMHGSQERSLRHLVRKGVEVYVIHEAERLGVPEFPLKITRLGGDLRDRTRAVDREWFDEWMTAGLYAPLFP